MPNSQTHLAAVWSLLARPPLQAAFPWLGEEHVQSALLLGAVAPDVRVVSGQLREETHFFDIPTGEQPGHDALFAAWPVLADSAALGAEQAAFVGGYLTHLIMDETWVEVVVMEGLFVEGLQWGPGHPNWRLYGLLMTYLEYQAAERLPPRAVELLGEAEPHGWLPFAADEHLRGWRDYVVSTIRQGGPRLLSRMFARSTGLSEADLESIVLSEERMAAEVFELIPRAQLAAFEVQTAQQAEAAVSRYWAPLAAPNG